MPQHPETLLEASGRCEGVQAAISAAEGPCMTNCEYLETSLRYVCTTTLDEKCQDVGAGRLLRQ